MHFHRHPKHLEAKQQYTNNKGFHIVISEIQQRRRFSQYYPK